jgi:hypothetical protein
MPRLLVSLIVLLAAALALAAPMPAAAAGSGVSAPTAEQIDAYLASKGSPMVGQGAAFIASGGRWQMDPRLIVAIAGAESSFGQITCAPFNAWGYGCPNGPYRFDSWADGIDAVAEGLRTNYLAEGRTTVATINLKYAPLGAANDPTGLNNNWTINVSRFLVELGGDPNDVDMDGIAGTVSLGPLGGGAPVEEFGFSEEPADGDAATGSDVLEVQPGTPRALVVRVKNTGTVTWSAQEVRLRRVDVEDRVVGAPFGALANAAAVAPGDVAEFAVQLAAVGSHSGTATTTWQLEGPSGAFGSEISRPVKFSVPAFVAGEPRVEVTAANPGIVPGPSAWNVVVHVRNDGSGTWQRDGDDGVLLGLVDVRGDLAAREGWINERAVGRMLERSAAPGEEASFAFRVRGEAVALLLRPFRPSGWAVGSPVVVRVGTAGDAEVAQLRDSTLATAG